MQKLVSFLSFFLFMVSCSSNSDATINETTPGTILLRRTIQTRTDISGDVPDITNFTYNGNKLVRFDSDSGIHRKFYYTGDLITRMEIYFQVEKEPIVFRYSYNSSGQLITVIRTDEVVDQGIKLTYTYNTNGTITVREFSGSTTSQLEEGATSTYFLNNTGAISRIDVQETSGSIMTTTYTFDTKENPYKNIVGFGKLLIPETGINNLTAMISSTDQDVDVTSSYTYNADNFPTVGMQVVTDSSNATTTSTIEYFYE